jgi:hypothetical protein
MGSAPGEPLEHSTAGFAKVLCSAVFITGRDPAVAADEDGFFVSSREERRHVVKTVVDREQRAVAEFVENSIYARARHITITRGKEQGEHSLCISDDGEGVPRDQTGVPDFRYVATHICDSLKRRLQADGASGIQGEFGIGLLSFWTVGEELTLTSAGADGRTYQMRMRKGGPDYTVVERHTLIPRKGTELRIRPLLPGLRQMSGEKIQWYLASELRDRIRQSGVSIKVVDRQARKEFKVEPREFTGRLLHELPAAATPLGEIYLELYFAEPGPANQVGLYRSGTRVLADLTELDAFQRPPWNLGYLQGIVDAPFLNLTPGTRAGVIHDDAFGAFCAALEPMGERLAQIIAEQKRAEEEKASREVLRAIQRAFQEALLALPAEEYDWFEVRARGLGGAGRAPCIEPGAPIVEPETAAGEPETEAVQKEFFEYAGPLFSVRVSPASCIVPVNGERTLRAVARDRNRHAVEHDVAFRWIIVEGEGNLENADGEIVTFHAPPRAWPGQDPGHRHPGRHRLRRAGDDHRHRVAAAREQGDRGGETGASRLHLRARPGRAVALALRRRAQRHRHQQRPPRLRLRGAQPLSQAPLPGAALRQGAGAQKLPRPSRRPVAGAHDRAVAVHRGKPQVNAGDGGRDPAPQIPFGLSLSKAGPHAVHVEIPMSGGNHPLDCALSARRGAG